MNDLASYFISDAHLGAVVPGHECREHHLISFLGRLQGRARYLFILGDLFEFWIEYGVLCRGDYFPVLHALRTLVDRGTEIHYLAGNHDFAFDRFLPEKVGVNIHRSDLRFRIGDKELYLFHGDGLLRADVGYRVLRLLFRNRINQRLYKVLHPALGVGFATRISSFRRRYFQVRLDESKLAEYREAAVQRLNAGVDIVVFGHTHVPQLFVGDRGTYCCTGEWMRRYTYGILRDGDMQLMEYRPDGDDQSLPPAPLK